MGRPHVEINKKRGENLKLLLENEGVKQIELSKRINLSQQTISRIIKGTASLTEETAKLIIKEFPEYSLDWLLAVKPLPSEASQRIVDRLNKIASHQKAMYSNLIEIVCDCGYSVIVSDQLTITRKSDKEAITLSKEEARSYYDELQNMISNFIDFHFERRKEHDNGKL